VPGPIAFEGARLRCVLVPIRISHWSNRAPADGRSRQRRRDFRPHRRSLPRNRATGSPGCRKRMRFRPVGNARYAASSVEPIPSTMSTPVRSRQRRAMSSRQRFTAELHTRSDNSCCTRQLPAQRAARAYSCRHAREHRWGDAFAVAAATDIGVVRSAHPSTRPSRHPPTGSVRRIAETTRQ